MRKLYLVIMFGAGLIIGVQGAKYFSLAYENELMTNWILKHEIKDYTQNKMEINLK